MQRRRFLKFTAGALATGALRLRFAQAAEANPTTLVVVFQRGGCDGLNTVVPFGDPYYAGLRPGIGIAPPNAGNPAAALNLNGFLGLHPALAPLHALYLDGRLGVLPAVQYPDASQSHFDGQRWIESGQPESSIDGWLNRYLAQTSIDAAVRAVSMGGSLAHALRGEVPVATLDDIGNLGFGGGDGEVLVNALATVYEQSIDAEDRHRAALHQAGLTFLDNLETLAAIDISNYVPENGAEYPESGFGTSLRQVAALIKADVGLEVATADIGGWDTHSGQGGAQGPQAGRHADFAAGIAALVTDLGTRMDDVLILSMTEFGRTAEENASGGTDHGHAAAWFAAGNGIHGGVHGAWPGLAPANLHDGRYLDHSIDFRDVMAEVLTRFLGVADTGLILPGFTPTPIGLIG
ncbi:MAG: DUF1501 domain-containing protein [Chromatiales bacterium]|nr:DUF1501 domain-containing protein [Chromatiales bacterium]